MHISYNLFNSSKFKTVKFLQKHNPYIKNLTSLCIIQPVRVPRDSGNCMPNKYHQASVHPLIRVYRSYTHTMLAASHNPTKRPLLNKSMSSLKSPKYFAQLPLYSFRFSSVQSWLVSFKNQWSMLSVQVYYLFVPILTVKTITMH